MSVSPAQAFADQDLPAHSPRRDFRGYGPEPPTVEWPGEARLAVQFVVNYEEGSERSFARGDGANEGFHEFPEVLGDQRDLDVESVYEYGSRAGIWRLLRILDTEGVTATFFATAVALQINPAVVARIVERGDEVAAHGYRWLNHFELDSTLEREWISRTTQKITELVGERPVGWYCRQMSERTRTLLVEHGGFLYDSDAYNDDLPYWSWVGDTPHLVVPYTLVVNDAHFLLSPTFARPDDFFELGRAAIDRLCDDGDNRSRMLSVGLHARISGHPARAEAVARLIRYAADRNDVWVARRVDIATTFSQQVPPTTSQDRP